MTHPESPTRRIAPVRVVLPPIACLLGLSGLIAGCQASDTHFADQIEPMSEDRPAPPPETTVGVERRAMFAGPVAPAELSRELIEMAERSRAVRREVLDAPGEPDRAALERLLEVDVRNTERLKQIIARYGWPTETLVGPEAADAAWLIAQQADHDPDFQAQVVNLVQPLAATGDVDRTEFAMLADGVRVARQRPQLYGTHYSIRQAVDGRSFLVPTTPIDAPAELDDRRAAIGLGPHAAYVQELQRLYAPRGGEVVPASDVQRVPGPTEPLEPRERVARPAPVEPAEPAPQPRPAPVEPIEPGEPIEPIEPLEPVEPVAPN